MSGARRGTRGGTRHDRESEENRHGGRRVRGGAARARRRRHRGPHARAGPRAALRSQDRGDGARGGAGDRARPSGPGYGLRRPPVAQDRHGDPLRASGAELVSRTAEVRDQGARPGRSDGLAHRARRKARADRRRGEAGRRDARAARPGGDPALERTARAWRAEIASTQALTAPNRPNTVSAESGRMMIPNVASQLTDSTSPTEAAT